MAKNNAPKASARHFSEALDYVLVYAKDRFFPDFCAKLRDGRYLVVEHKGTYLDSTDESKEKRQMGELWAKMSNEKCLFCWTTTEDYASRLREVLG